MQDSVEQVVPHILQLIVQYGPIVGGAVGMKALDIISDRVKEFFKQRGETEIETTDILDSNGETVMTVKRKKRKN